LVQKQRGASPIFFQWLSDEREWIASTKRGLLGRWGNNGGAGAWWEKGRNKSKTKFGDFSGERKRAVLEKARQRSQDVWSEHRGL